MSEQIAVIRARLIRARLAEPHGVDTLTYQEAFYAAMADVQALLALAEDANKLHERLVALSAKWLERDSPERDEDGMEYYTESDDARAVCAEELEAAIKHGHKI